MNEPKASQDSQVRDALPPVDAGLSRLYRATAGDEPPPALDMAILKAAREAVAPQPVSAQPTPWWKRLKVPVTIAATVMLTVMLTLTVDRNPPEIMLEKAHTPVPKTLSPAPPAVPAETRADTQAPARADDAGVVRQSVPAALVPAPAAIADRAEKKSKGASVPAATEAVTRPPAAMEIPSAVPVTPREKSESVEGRASVSAERERSADRAPAMAPAGVAAPMLESAAKRAAPRPETVWLEEIRSLRRQGKLDEAARRLAEFRAAYPDYPLPDDLK